MTLETNQKHSDGDIVGYLNQKNVHDVFIVSVLSILADRSITLFYWKHEANALVSTLGKEMWLAITAVLVGIMWLSWYRFKAYQHRYAVYCMLIITTFHLIAAVTNVIVVIF